MSSAPELELDGSALGRFESGCPKAADSAGRRDILPSRVVFKTRLRVIECNQLKQVRPRSCLSVPSLLAQWSIFDSVDEWNKSDGKGILEGDDRAVSKLSQISYHRSSPEREKRVLKPLYIYITSTYAPAGVESRREKDILQLAQP